MSERRTSRPRPSGTSAEITLDQVARTAIELHKLFPNEVAIHGDTLAQRGQQAIELLYIWKRLLEIEEGTGAAAKNAREIITRWRTLDEEARRRHEELEVEAGQRAEWTKIANTRQIPLAQAARIVLPKKRNAIVWLERILTILTEKKSPLPETLIRMCREALKYKSIREGLIPYLEDSRDFALKTYRSRTAKKSGQKGGIRRAQKYSRNKTAAENSISEEN